MLREIDRQEMVSRLAGWIESAARRRYAPNDKRRYAALTIDGNSAVMDLRDAVQILSDGDDDYVLSERWMTPAEFESMKEFSGW